MKNPLLVSVDINAPLKTVWNLYTDPQHITEWNQASPDWHTPKAENDLKTGGSFSYRMEAKDGSAGFDFGGTYDAVQPEDSFSYTMDDERKAVVSFVGTGKGTRIEVQFEPEGENPLEMQQAGWQAILDNFKKYAELNA